MNDNIQSFEDYKKASSTEKATLKTGDVRLINKE